MCVCLSPTTTIFSFRHAVVRETASRVSKRHQSARLLFRGPRSFPILSLCVSEIELPVWHNVIPLLQSLSTSSLFFSLPLSVIISCKRITRIRLYLFEQQVPASFSLPANEFDAIRTLYPQGFLCGCGRIRSHTSLIIVRIFLCVSEEEEEEEADNECAALLTIPACVCDLGRAVYYSCPPLRMSGNEERRAPE